MISTLSNNLQQQQADRVQTQLEGVADSDSDWDDDDDFISKRINIKIKPVAQLTPNKIDSSVDELKAAVGTWKSMSSINLVKPNSRRSHHQSSLLLNKTVLDTEGDSNQVPLALNSEIISQVDTFLSSQPVMLPPPLAIPPRSTMMIPSSSSSILTQERTDNDQAKSVPRDSDSDSDWGDDDDDEFCRKRIQFKIKPIMELTPKRVTANDDELKAVVGTWKSMSNISLVKPNSRRSLNQSNMALDKLHPNTNNRYNQMLYPTFRNENNNIVSAMNLPPIPSRKLNVVPPPLPPRLKDIHNK